VAMSLLDDHLRHCVSDAIASDSAGANEQVDRGDCRGGSFVEELGGARGYRGTLAHASLRESEHEAHRPFTVMVMVDTPRCFRRRFWWSLLLTIPVVMTSQMVMDWFNYELDFRGIGSSRPRCSAASSSSGRVGRSWPAVGRNCAAVVPA
jgi:hypothetical protein